ncbi:MAG: enoyl-CoA hydratase [Dehalococcoidia bacterium]|nr:enoyl-CoA hydratase [Dehalococcoidia bacterium]
MDYAKYAENFLDIKVDGGVAIVTLNRPDRLNAVGAAMHHGLERLLEEVNYDPNLRAIVLTGAGTKAFSAGGDVSEMGVGPMKGPGYLFRGPRYLVQTFLNCEVPIVAAVNGYALGLGASIVVLSDIIYMADTATIGDTHTAVGLVAGDGGAIMWPAMVGMHKAKEMLLLSKRLSAAEAEKLGLVNHVVPADKLMEEATACARKLAEGAPLAIRWTKMTMNKLLMQSAQANLDFGLAAETMSMQTEDHAEAKRAFAEKRKPKFQGR